MIAFGRAAGGGRREDNRESARLCVGMTTMSQSYTAELIDISATGARLRCNELPEVGFELYLKVDRIKTFCTVRWTSGTDCGVQFDEPLPQDDVIAVRREVAAGYGVDPAIRSAMDDWVLGLAR